MIGNKIISLAILCAMLTSCGLKGGLYKEDKKPQIANNVIENEIVENMRIISANSAKLK